MCRAVTSWTLQRSQLELDASKKAAEANQPVPVSPSNVSSVSISPSPNFDCKLVGKALEVYSTLSLEESLKYDSVKSAILRAYELVPEAYRQKFCTSLPMKGVDLILGNDLAGGKVMPLLEVLDKPTECASDEVDGEENLDCEKTKPERVRGQLKVLKDRILEKDSLKTNVVEYVTKFRERLHTACSVARESLANAQKGMKRTFDKKAVTRSFKPGDSVLVFLPIPGSSLSTRFFGPYIVKEKLSETNYVICTPERKRKTRVCHVNMLKLYHSRSQTNVNDRAPDTAVISVAVVTEKPIADADEDGVMFQNISQSTVRLCNSEILKDLDSHLTNLSIDQKCDLVRLISEFECLFKDVPTLTNVIQHDIDVKDASPIRQHAYRVNSVKRSVMRQEVDYLLNNGLAKPSSSPWSSPCILVPKPDGSFRFCTDFRKVNSLTVPDNYPLPRMEDCVDNVGYAKFVSKLDMLKGYWQVPLTPRASEIAAFITPDSFAQYTAMAFGLRNAPATFQRDWDEHMKSLRAVFERFASASLTLNLAKCEFGQAKFPRLDVNSEDFSEWLDITAAFAETSPPDLERPFKLEVDASNVGAGAVLLQDDEQGIAHPQLPAGLHYIRPRKPHSHPGHSTNVTLLDPTCPRSEWVSNPSVRHESRTH
ncbi:Transposon Ty3-I Gag-Pol polyprotein [Labeo rohita]|uniref:ribonuclease H n=1 Tax=Labeo rohita TaxID=84645 RepID=A0ABQ8MR62_LABRO|nr:Transposon Ty3-I Gag-Pol polyprotein [Labeo rohita]